MLIDSRLIPEIFKMVQIFPYLLDVFARAFFVVHLRSAALLGGAVRGLGLGFRRL